MITETIQQIAARLINKLKATPPFNIPTLSPSLVALWNNFLEVIATEIFALEQLSNIFETEIDIIIKGSTTQTAIWWQKRILEFQYSDTTPQILQLDQVSLTFYYPTINPALRIVTNCSIVPSSPGVIKIKVTSNGSVLTNLQIAALTAYIQIIGNAGIVSTIINAAPDLLYLNADIYYNGTYQPVIQPNVIAALNTYLANIPFDGIVKTSAVEDTIQNVPGVTDVVINSISARNTNQSFADKTAFIKSYQTFSGQIIQETTSGNTFSDTLNFIVG